ncbi:MAG: hypothetical protein QM770_14540 [Tepidisphaeraceae bacterium]
MARHQDIRMGHGACHARTIRLRSHGITLADLLVLLAMVGLLLTVGLAVQARSRETAYRAKCLSHLKQIGTALRIYEVTSGNTYPRTIASVMTGNASPLPVWGTPYEQHPDVKASPTPVNPFDGKSPDHTPSPNDITASIYLLVSTADMPLEVFVCSNENPTATPWDFDGASPDRWTNWRGNDGLARHFGYSFQNMFASDVAIERGFGWNSRQLTSEFAIASDLAPGDVALKAKLTDRAPLHMAANSFNHGRDGQNVLFGDGHADWSSTVFAGVDKDNIFTANGPETGRANASPMIVASPVDANDSILLPTAQLLGVKPPEVREAETNLKVYGVIAGGILVFVIVWLLMRSSKRTSTPAA